MRDEYSGLAQYMGHSIPINIMDTKKDHYGRKYTLLTLLGVQNINNDRRRMMFIHCTHVIPDRDE